MVAGYPVLPPPQATPSRASAKAGDVAPTMRLGPRNRWHVSHPFDV